MGSEHFALPKRRPGGWCGTEISDDPNEADQVPADDKMPDQVPVGDNIPPAFLEGKRSYPCITQDGVMPTLGQPPQPSGGSRHGGTSIMVGVRELIPRWVASTTNPTKLLYFVVEDGFTDDDFEYTASSFQEAADEWNALSIGVNISATTDRATANFLVRYFKPEEDSGVIASAFFPNRVKDVLVFDKTLVEPFWRNILKNSFLHEIGHIIGLRHEFANDPDPDNNNQPFESPAQRFGSVNPHSVMSYDDINNINDLDKKDTKAFYQLPNLFKIGEATITDFVPKLLQHN